MIKKEADRFYVEYETGAQKELRLRPDNAHTFYLPVRTMDDLEQLELPDPDDARRYEGIRQDAAWAKRNGLLAVGLLNGFFSGVHYFLREYQEFLMDLVAEPAFAKALIDKIGEWNLVAARRLCEAGVDCIDICDDLGSDNSMLISPRLCSDYVLPWHKKLCEVAHSYGVYVHLHSHGRILPILKELAGCGIDILNPLDPHEMGELEDARELVGPKMVMCGGLNKFFFSWEEQRQRETLVHVIRQSRRLGPHILMDSGGVPDNTTAGAFTRFLEMSSEYGRGQGV